MIYLCLLFLIHQTLSLTVPVPLCSSYPTRSAGGRCSQVNDCYTIVSGGREVCYYTCGSKGNFRGRRGYQCYQIPPLKPVWSATFETSDIFSGPGVLRDSIGAFGSSKSLKSDLSSQPADTVSNIGSYTFPSNLIPKAERVSFLYRIDSGCLFGSVVQLKDSSGTNFFQFQINNTFPIVNNVVIGSSPAPLSTWNSIEFDLDFSKSVVKDIRLGDDSANPMPVLLGNATFLSVATDLASISLSNIAPCVVHWDSFVVWDRQVPAFK